MAPSSQVQASRVPRERLAAGRRTGAVPQEDEEQEVVSRGASGHSRLQSATSRDCNLVALLRTSVAPSLQPQVSTSPNKEGDAGHLRNRFHIRNRFQRADRFQRSRQRSGDLSGQSLLGRSIGAISGDLSGQSREIYRGNLGRSIGAISPGPRCSHARFVRRPRPHVVLSSCVYRVTECSVLSCCSSFVLSLSIAEMSSCPVSK
jgi:hypothetical protein